MKVVLVGLIILLAACKPTQPQYPDFPPNLNDTFTNDTLEVRFGDNGFRIALPDSSMMKAFDSLLDKIKEQYRIQDSVKRSKKVT